MELTGVESQAAIQEMMRLKAKGQGEDGEGKVDGQRQPPPPPPDGMQTSQLGSIFQNFDELSEEEKETLKSFLDEVKQSAGSDSFDAAAMAENASDEMKTLAEKYGVDLESALTEIQEHVSMMEEKVGGFPPYGMAPPDGMMPPPEESTSENTSDSVFALAADEEDA